MVNLKQMQAKVDKMLSVFTKLKAELDAQKDVLCQAISDNNKKLQDLNAENQIYAHKIKEYDALATNIDKFLGKE